MILIDEAEDALRGDGDAEDVEKAGRAPSPWSRMLEEGFWSGPGLGEALGHRNAEDDEEGDKEDEESLKSIKDLSGKLFGGEDGQGDPEALDRFERIFSDLEDYSPTDPEAFETAGGFAKALRDAARGTPGTCRASFGAGEAFPHAAGFRKSKSGGLAVDMRVRDFSPSTENGEEAGKLADRVEKALRKLGLGPSAPLEFRLNGVRLEVESSSTVAHDEDDDATFCVSFDDDQSERALAAGERNGLDLMTAKGAAGAIRRAVAGRSGVSSSRAKLLKAVCVLEGSGEDGEGQEVWQVSRPAASGSQATAFLQKCTSWRFREIEGDPQTLGALELADAFDEAAAKGATGYVFLKARGQTYGISGVDFINGRTSGEGQLGFMLALTVRPWTELEESVRPPSPWSRMLDESFWRGA